MKALFTLSVAALGFAALDRAGRPHVRARARLLFIALPFVAIALLAARELMQLAPSARTAVWLGSTWQSCPFSIFALSIPALALLMRNARKLAPQRPALAGLAAGLLSGGIGATAYGLHCPEFAASFIATWYALGMLLTGAAGALWGSRRFRW
jgi:hypothetical protein